MPSTLWAPTRSLYTCFSLGISDLFRDASLSGWLKALWILLLIALPVLTALVYLMVRGRRMALRQLTRAQEAAASTEGYLGLLAGTPEPARHIFEAKALLDSRTISEDEFAGLKTKALA